jgi:hypothetical protein
VSATAIAVSWELTIWAADSARSCSAVLDSGYIASNGITATSSRSQPPIASTSESSWSGLVILTVVSRSPPSVS